MMPGTARNKKRHLLALRLRVSGLAASLWVICGIAQRVCDHFQSHSRWSACGLEVIISGNIFHLACCVIMCTFTAGASRRNL